MSQEPIQHRRLTRQEREYETAELAFQREMNGHSYMRWDTLLIVVSVMRVHHLLHLADEHHTGLGSQIRKSCRQAHTWLTASITAAVYVVG